MRILFELLAMLPGNKQMSTPKSTSTESLGTITSSTHNTTPDSK